MSFFDLSGFFPLPLWKLLLDVAVACMMWAILARFVVVVVFGDTPPLAVLRSVLRLTNRLMRVFGYINPRALTPAAQCLSAAFFIFLLRYYGLPAILDYNISGLASLPAEARLTDIITELLRLI